MTTTVETQVDNERLAELEAEIEAAGDELGAAAVEFERVKYARDRARGRHMRAMSKRELFLAGKDV